MTSSPTQSSDSFTTEVVVVGAGPAGLFQLFQLGLQGIACHAIDALPHPGGQCAELYPHKPIYDIPAIGCVTGAQLAKQLHEQLNPFTVGWHCGHTVIAIDQTNAGGYTVRTDRGHAIECKAVVLALGVGAFVPRKPKLEQLDALIAQSKQVFLQSHDRAAPVAGQHVIVFGGDEAAVQKALTLAALPTNERPHRITLLHRRDVFKADAAALAQLDALRDQGVVQVAVGQLQELHTSPRNTQQQLDSLQITDNDGQTQTLEAGILLIYQGISPKLGAMLDWGLELDSKHIAVNPATQESSREGIFAIGDIASYPGKRKLIASAFHEALMASYAIAERLHGKSPLTLYTTTSTILLERLGQQPVEKI
ncbi:NAD(P)/FAD-dependent oxidoreductase [Lampropedia puyangensis]|uniref:Ferredoxin--NADP reductase n=1 Tax=Lampropedia puyangensis TaxID=1330072 RepID=A0A4S8EZ95_9BURK|nr:NAD(P)/FAD-dependent oxidoreductase [Lampropedia puyangensis]THT99274.1 NAD(P)/FAD-dependent oxidoreductase [Lampropedia puyangensis]